MPQPPIRILIVDDSALYRQLVRNVLRDVPNVEVVGLAKDGQEALEQVERLTPDLLTLDVLMPGLSGIDVLRELKQRRRPTKAIMLSSLTANGAQVTTDALLEGAFDFILKPSGSDAEQNRRMGIGRSPGSRGRTSRSATGPPVDVPVADADPEPGMELSVTLAGQTYRVKSGRQQVLNLLISTFENAVEKNRELHRLNEQLTLAKEKLTTWNQTLESLNLRLDAANQRMSHDLEAAARVQRSLLPAEHLDLPGVIFSWHYTPCDELAGDFLNFFALDDRHVAMFVVDVSGHGAASALLAVAIGRFLTSRASASSLLVRKDPVTSELQITPPAEVACELNRRFPMETQGELYFTKAYGILDLETYQLRYVSAGHPPMVLVPKDGPPQFLPGEGFAIGMIEDIDYDEQTIQLRPGDRIFCYSDGVPEAMNEELQLFSNERMLSTLAASADRPLVESVEDLFETVRNWCLPHGPKDDVSILACEIVGRAG